VKSARLLLVLLPFFATAQDLSLEKIMSDPIWLGEIPRNARIAHETGTIYFQVPTPYPLPAKWMKWTGNEAVEISDVDRAYVGFGNEIERGDTTVFGVNGDLWVSRDGAPRVPLIVSSDRLSPIGFIDDTRFVYSNGDQLHLFYLGDGTSIQLTDLKKADEPKDDEMTLLTSEERDLFRAIEHEYMLEDHREETREEGRDMGSLEKPKSVYLGKKGELADPSISGDLHYVAVVVAADDGGDRTQYADFINKTAELEVRRARPRVGHKTPTWKAAVYDNDAEALTWLDFSELPEIKTDRLADVRAEQSEEDKELMDEVKEDTPRPISIWSDGFGQGNQLLLTIQSRDYKDRWIVLVDAETGKWTLVDHHYDEAWTQIYMRGTGHSNDRSGRAWWSDSREAIYFLSDATGYQHIYRYDPARGESVQLTSGDYEIFAPFEGPLGKRLYFHANKVHPGERHLYSMPIGGGEWKQHTREPGLHTVEVSADGSVMLDTFSRANRPPVLRVKKGNGRWKTIVDGRSDEFQAIDWAVPEYVTYENRDGKSVYARLYRPANPNGAGVVFVHGAGYLQNAHKGWSSYFREYMFHNLLLREGYTILDPDFQASAGYGRDWRTAIYRHMGGKDLTDVVDGANWLVSEHGVDAKRLGVYGGSYGGFITFMAMFTEPEVFASGAALRPVSDWAHYNHWYTARILNTPTVDPIAYRRSSPIYFAEGLEGRLLMCHGMVDGNVQYIDVIRLSQRLIELGKKGWELASYPVEPHGFQTPSGWYDEYRRIHELFSQTLK